MASCQEQTVKSLQLPSKTEAVLSGGEKQRVYPSPIFSHVRKLVLHTTFS